MREERKAGTEGAGLAAHKVNAILKALLKPRRQRADRTSKTAQPVHSPSPRSKQVSAVPPRACCHVTWGGSGGKTNTALNEKF